MEGTKIENRGKDGNIKKLIAIFLVSRLLSTDYFISFVDVERGRQ